MESVCWGNSTVGSNPTLSAILNLRQYGHDFCRAVHWDLGMWSTSGLATTSLVAVRRIARPLSGRILPEAIGHVYTGVRGDSHAHNLAYRVSGNKPVAPQTCLSRSIDPDKGEVLRSLLRVAAGDHHVQTDDEALSRWSAVSVRNGFTSERNP